MPLVLVMVAIVVVAGLFTQAAARRQAVDVRTMIVVPGWGNLVLGSIVAGGGFAATSALAGLSWRDASVAGAVFAVAWAALFRYRLNRKRQAGLLAEAAATDDPQDTPAS